METIFGGVAPGSDDKTSLSSRSPIPSLPRGKDDLVVVIRHYTGDQRYVTVPHPGASVSDIKVLYLDLISKLSAKEQQTLTDSTAHFSAASGGAAASSMGTGGGGGLTTSGAFAGTTRRATTVMNPVTSTRFSGVLGKSFNFKHINASDITFASRDGHILAECEKVASFRRSEAAVIELFVVPQAPHKLQEPVLVVAPLFPFPAVVEPHIVIRDFDFSSCCSSSRGSGGVASATGSLSSSAASSEMLLNNSRELRVQEVALPDYSTSMMSSSSSPTSSSSSSAAAAGGRATSTKTAVAGDLIVHVHPTSHTTVFEGASLNTVPSQPSSPLLSTANKNKNKNQNSNAGGGGGSSVVVRCIERVCRFFPQVGLRNPTEPSLEPAVPGTDRPVAYFSGANWSPVHAWIAPDGNFAIVHLISKEEEPDTTATNNPAFASSSSSSSPPTAMMTPTVFLIFESVARGSAWTCRGAFRVPLTGGNDISLSGWCNDARFVVCVGATAHIVVRVEPEGQVSVHCTRILLDDDDDDDDGGGDDDADDAKTATKDDHRDDKNNNSPSVTPRSKRQKTTRHSALQLIRVLPGYTDSTMVWFDPSTSVLRVFHPDNVNGLALHLKRLSGKPLLFNYLLQSRAPKWQITESSLPQFVLSPGDVGFSGFALGETRLPPQQQQQNNSQQSSSSSSSDQKNKSSSAAAASSSVPSSNNLSMATVVDHNQQQQNNNNKSDEGRPTPLAVHFLHRLDAAQTAPDPPDEALLLFFPEHIIHVSEHGREDTFKTSYVSPPIQSGTIVATQYAKPATHPAGGGGGSPTTGGGFAMLRVVYCCDSPGGVTSIHVVTLQSEWKTPVEKEATFFGMIKKKLAFLRSSSDDATATAAKAAQKLAQDSHKELRLAGIDAFQRGACDCFMASAAPVGLVVKATGAGGVAVVRLRAPLVGT